MDRILDTLRNQWQGIIVGILVGTIVSIILKIPQWVYKFFKNIRNRCYRGKLQKEITIRINETNEEIGLPLLPKIELEIVDISKNILELEDKIIIPVRKEKKPRVMAEIFYLSIDRGFLYDAKRYIGEKLSDSIKYVVGKSLITRDTPVEELGDFEKETLRYFERKMEDILTNPEIAKLINKEEAMLSRRLFKTVLLQEIFALGERHLGILPEEECKEETLGFVDFLCDIAQKEKYEKEKGEEPHLDFIGRYFKVGIVLIKKPEKNSLYPHLNAVRNKIKKGVLSIYILGLGRNVKDVEGDFVKWMGEISKQDYPDWRVEKVIKYKLPKMTTQKDIPGICVIFRHKKWITS